LQRAVSARGTVAATAQSSARQDAIVNASGARSDGPYEGAFYCLNQEIANERHPYIFVVYATANMPEADGVTVGGAADFTKCVAFQDLTPAGAVDWVSTPKAAGYASPLPAGPAAYKGAADLKTQGTTHLSESPGRYVCGHMEIGRRHASTTANPVCRGGGDANVYQVGGIG
jgi:hypothetical protein